MNKNLAEDNKKTRFTKDNQPSNESKRKPKWRKALKEKILKEFDPMIESIIADVKETGNSASFDRLMDRAFGKVKDKVSMDIHGSLNKMLKDSFFDNTED